jgi:hypothetical protein
LNDVTSRAAFVVDNISDDFMAVKMKMEGEVEREAAVARSATARHHVDDSHCTYHNDVFPHLVDIFDYH